MPILKKFTPLSCPTILTLANTYPHSGSLQVTPNHLTYLKLVDKFILELYPFLQKYNPKIEKPDYFSQPGVGAHISIIYPEEATRVPKEEINKIYHFDISGLYKTGLGSKEYYVLGVKSPELTQLRIRHGLSKKLLFKGYLVDLHITLGKLPR